MAITYPLALPTTVGLDLFTLRQMDVVAISRSPFSLAQQVYAHSGACWMAELSWPILTQAQAAEIIAFLDSLRGVYGTFTMGDPVFTAPTGTGLGTPLVNGANAIRSTTLATKGWTPSSQVLKGGDLFQLGSAGTSRLYRNLTTVTADGSGNATLDIWPPLRAAAANNDAIVTSNPKGLWRLASNERQYEVVKPRFFRIALAAVEALP
jgi:hypothetical protein